MKIAIVGVGGRTGSLFAYELKNTVKIFGFAGKKSYEKILKGNVFINKNRELFKLGTNLLTNNLNEDVDFLFLTVKNPIKEVLKEYLTKIGKPVNLILSQNGITAVDEAKEAIYETFHKIPSEIRIIRLVLFNAVSMTKDANTIISYKTPIRVAFGVAFGKDDLDDLIEVFKDAKFEFTTVKKEDIKNMEYSKLFTNLIGLPSFSNGLNIYEGLKDKKSFEEEIGLLKEYIRVVEANGGEFSNFPHYPIKFFAKLVKVLPVGLLSLFRSLIAVMVLKLRGAKEKGNIDEIDYYIGNIIELARKKKIEVPICSEVLRRVNERIY
ncbi:MAG: hypothetical protein K6343_03545 [Caldisericaceae bacterium]